jgi:hypothetical protein
MLQVPDQSVRDRLLAHQIGGIPLNRPDISHSHD